MPSHRPARDLYLEDRVTPPYDGFPLAFDYDGMRQVLRNSRYFIAVVDMSNNRIIKIVMSPVITDDNEKQVGAAYTRKLHEISEQYRIPEFDVLVGCGTIKSFSDSIGEQTPFYEWKNATVEDL